MAVEIEQVDPSARWEEVEPLLRALHEHHLPMTGVPLLADWAAIQREHLARQRDAIFLLATEGGRAVGFVNGWISRRPAIFEEEYARLENVYVRDEVRGMGVGLALLEAFEARCVDEGITEIRLGVVVGNDLGRRFWDAAGFVPASVAMKKQLA